MSLFICVIKRKSQKRTDWAGSPVFLIMDNFILILNLKSKLQADCYQDDDVAASYAHC